MAGDARDPSTLRHSERVSALAERIAVELGWEPGRLRRLRDAALLHDVGKLAIPDAVLFKPGRLDRDEYEQVKAHAAATPTADRAEHPRWRRDPRVADAYDAMTVVRPYSAPLLAAEALEECRRLSGAQFDPDAVAALAIVLDRTAEDRYPSRWGSRTS